MECNLSFSVNFITTKITFALPGIERYPGTYDSAQQSFDSTKLFYDSSNGPM